MIGFELAVIECSGPNIQMYPDVLGQYSFTISVQYDLMCGLIRVVYPCPTYNKSAVDDFENVFVKTFKISKKRVMLLKKS